MFLVNLVPIFNIGFAVWFGTAAGTEGPNKYGADTPPLPAEVSAMWFVAFLVAIASPIIAITT